MFTSKKDKNGKYLPLAGEKAQPLANNAALAIPTLEQKSTKTNSGWCGLSFSSLFGKNKKQECSAVLNEDEMIISSINQNHEKTNKEIQQIMRSYFPKDTDEATTDQIKKQNQELPGADYKELQQSDSTHIIKPTK